MRRQLVAALAGLAVFTLLAYVSPRTYITASLVRDHQHELLDQTADFVVIGLQTAEENDVDIGPEVLQQLLEPGQELRLERPDGTTTVVGGIAGDGATATRRTLPDGSVLEVRLSDDVVADAVFDALAPVVLIGSAVVAVSVAVAIVLSRRLVRPFHDLADYARSITGDDPGPAPRAGMPEADDLAGALEQSFAEVRALVLRERQFSANASHQLRTPLAALRLRLEDLAHWPEASPEVKTELAEAMQEVERLSGTITDLLELARLGGIGSWGEVDVTEAVQAAAEQWAPLYVEAGRRIVVSSPNGRVVAPTSRRGLRQVVNVILENALVHGTGTVRVDLAETERYVAIRVSDEGTFDAEAAEGAFERSERSSASGIGLSLAQTIAEATGARVLLASTSPTMFEVRVPTVDTGHDGTPVRPAGSAVGAR